MSKITRTEFINSFYPVYKEYSGRFSKTHGMKTEINQYIDSLYPSKKKWLGLITYTVRFEDKILKAQDDGIYEMVMLNAITIRHFLSYFKYIMDNGCVKEVSLDSMLRRFTMEGSKNDTLSLRYVLSSIPKDKEWVDVFGFKERVVNIIKTIR